VKKGFSIIELVFAIVVIGITVSVFPRLIQQTQRSSELALKQELVYNASTMAQRINSAFWDSAYYSTAATTELSRSRVPLPKYTIANETSPGIITDASIGSVKSSAGLYRKVTTDNPTSKGQFTNVSYDSNGKKKDPSKAVGDADRALMDVDDYDGQRFKMTNQADNGDYIITTDMSITVNYLNANFRTNGRTKTIVLDPSRTGGTSHIKVAAVSAAESEGNQDTATIYMFVSNIGELPILRQQGIDPKYFDDNTINN